MLMIVHFWWFALAGIDRWTFED